MSRRRPAAPPPPARASEFGAGLWLKLAPDVATAAGGAAADWMLLQNVVTAADRLEQIGVRLEEEGLTTDGSAGQVRLHPLLKFEADLRAELAAGLNALGVGPRRDYDLDVGPNGKLRRA